MTDTSWVPTVIALTLGLVGFGIYYLGYKNGREVGEHLGYLRCQMNRIQELIDKIDNQSEGAHDP